MAHDNLADLIKIMIKEQSLTADSISNIKGIPIVDTKEPVANVTGNNWQISYLDSLDMMSPSEILSKVVLNPARQNQIVPSDGGILQYTSIVGTTLATTIVDLPQSTGFPIEVIAPGRQIAVYIDETFLKRSINYLQTTINFPGGQNPLNVVTTGRELSIVKVTIPPDIRTGVSTYKPPTPVWSATNPISTNYIDPRTGLTGNLLQWYNQDKVGGWNAYVASGANYGTVREVSQMGSVLVLRTSFSGIAPFLGSEIRIGSFQLGTITQSIWDTNSTDLIIGVNTFSQDLTIDQLISGTVFVYTYKTLNTILKSSVSSNTVSFVDISVQKGVFYEYALDSFSPYDFTYRSAKTSTRGVTTGDVYAPSGIILTTVQVDSAKLLKVSYITPTDLDYMATRVTWYFQGSGTGQIANTSMVVDYGMPNSKDSLQVQGVTSGTFYFTTIDQSSNEQPILSGVPYYWNGSGSAVGAQNQTPTISVAQLSSTEMTIDSKIFAQFKLTASDQESPGTVIPQYIIMSGTTDPWISAPTNPYTITIPRYNKDVWLRARAFDGSLYSDEYKVSADFDTTPEVASVYSRYIVASGITYINGAVDDDTKSIKWYIEVGAEAGDPTFSNQTLVDNLVSNKLFNFSFNQPDGTKKILVIVPYPNLVGAGTAGTLYREEFIRLPRTKAIVQDRTSGGGIMRTSALLTFNAVPSTATTYFRIRPLFYGTVTSGISTTLTDNTQAMTINAYSNNFNVEIVRGKGYGQVRTVSSNDAKTFVISPSWTIIPDSTSSYYLNQAFRPYNDYGKATSATAKSLSDSVKGWIVNLFQGRVLEIYSGTGAGQIMTIASGIVSTQYTTLNFNTIPDTTSGYKLYGAIVIAKDPLIETYVEYYSEVISSTGIGLKEEVQSLIIDSDAIPEIASGTLTLLSSGIFSCSISGIDEDAKTWKAWIRKNNWPTVSSGSSVAAVNDDYLRFYGSTDTKSFSFSASQGWWYGIVNPFDSYGSEGPRVVFSGNIGVGGGSPNAAITSTGCDRISGGGLIFNRPWWTHNPTCEGNANTIVKIFTYNSAAGPDSEVEITPSPPRRADFDSEAGSPTSNSDDSNSITGYGSIVHIVKSGLTYSTQYYRVELYESGVLRGLYYTDYSDYYRVLQ